MNNMGSSRSLAGRSSPAAPPQTHTHSSQPIPEPRCVGQCAVVWGGWGGWMLLAMGVLGGCRPPPKPPGYLPRRDHLPSHGPGRGQEGSWARLGLRWGGMVELPLPTMGVPDLGPAWAGLARGDGPGRPPCGAPLPGGCGPGPRPLLPEGLRGTVGAAEGQSCPDRVPVRGPGGEGGGPRSLCQTSACVRAPPIPALLLTPKNGPLDDSTLKKIYS